ncbi:hypothetical protein VPNG_06717 [Cytospora leucostoma]|uniref:Uncharacterized protein n=1 Tax=Cytospora leucostoma TaxID=1230097 RepID=A0A423WTT8_9PEZI|nr:hypothetical protein VPNG_06717 [Cytospora leucostoma]
MPGRQSHGRSLMGNSKPSTNGKRNNQKSKTKSRAHALDAFAIASKQVQPDRLTRRGRDLELDPEKQSRSSGKHSRDEDEDDEDDEDEDDEDDEGPRKKRVRKSAAEDDDEDDADSDDFDGGSDSEGNEWHVGVNKDDDDSEIESDEAFGESDDEKFEGYTFRGSRSQKEEAEEDGDDGESLGSDAIDLADALDQSSDDDDDEGSQGDTESGSEEEDSATESDEESDDEDVDPSNLSDLQKIIKGFAGADEKDTEADSGRSSKQAISLQALGLTNVKDPLIKKPVKFIKKEEKAELTKKGSKKLDVPLPRRQQDQLLRIAAQEKTNETLDRWNETVKHNRRADHLVFPLAQNAADAGLDKGELLPLTKKTAGNELEQTIMSIMEESGLGPSAKQQEKEQEKKIDANGEEQTISRSELKDLWAQRRKERELQSREQARSKRIKKIKSKTYRRVHRKERLGEEEKLHDEMVATGEIDSEDEREAAHRRRALERVGARHKDSKWAKMGSKVGRAAWDDDYRAGLTDMARKDEELRKRIEGKISGADGDDDSDATSSSGDDEGNSRLLRDLDALDNDDGDEDAGPHSQLLQLKFMQRAEAQRKQANDDLVAQIRRELDSGSEQEDDDAEVQVGRRSFGLAKNKKRSSQDVTQSVATNSGALSNGAKAKPSRGALSNGDLGGFSAAESAETPSAPGAAGAWSMGKSSISEKKKKKNAASAQAPELDLTSNIAIASKPASVPKATKAPKSKNTTIITTGQQPVFQAQDDDSSDDEIHLPLAIRDQDLISRAFAGEDVVGEFEAEKDAIMSEEDEKVVDNTMPGWGAWAGEGISKRAQKRNKGKVMTKKEGIKRKDRKDAKLERVIVNEKRVRKNEKYLASQLPYPFESRQQYERSLRLPVGPEWATKESFQDATKPRVIVKQGIIAPMAKPTI